MERCETCKHWRQNDGWNDAVSAPIREWGGYPAYKEHPRYAELFQHNRDSGVCDAADVGWDWLGDGPIPIATCWDGSEYRAELHTHKSFGCVLWEASDD